MTAWEKGLRAAAEEVWNDTSFMAEEKVRIERAVRAFLAEQPGSFVCLTHHQAYPYPFVCDDEDEPCEGIYAGTGRLVVEP